jgi:hypothetical protein
MGERYLKLNLDGTISVRWGNTVLELREPTMAEATEIVGLFERIDAAYIEKRSANMSASTLLLGDTASLYDAEPAGYFAVFAKMIEVLKDPTTESIETTKLPSWAGNRSMWSDIVNHWLDIPLVRGETV